MGRERGRGGENEESLCLGIKDNREKRAGMLKNALMKLEC